MSRSACRTKLATITLHKANDRITLISSVAQDGKVYVENGKIVSSGLPAPSQTRCPETASADALLGLRAHRVFHRVDRRIEFGADQHHDRSHP